MNLLHVRVSQIGNGYLAESRIPPVTAAGSSVEEAAENARLMAIELFDMCKTSSHPTTLIVRIDRPGRTAFAMQSMQKPFSLATLGEECGTYYFDSAGNDAVPESE